MHRSEVCRLTTFLPEKSQMWMFMRCKRTRPKLSDDDDDDTFKKEVSPARMSGKMPWCVQALRSQKTRGLPLGH